MNDEAYSSPSMATQLRTANNRRAANTSCDEYLCGVGTTTMSHIIYNFSVLIYLGSAIEKSHVPAVGNT